MEKVTRVINGMVNNEYHDSDSLWGRYTAVIKDLYNRANHKKGVSVQYHMKKLNCALELMIEYNREYNTENRVFKKRGL